MVSPLPLAGEGGARDSGRVRESLGSCRLGNRFEDALYVSKHLMIPEPQDPITLLHQESLTTRVLLLLGCVLPPVQLDDETALETHEIDDVWTKHVLAAKLEPRKLAAAQMMPQQAFRICGKPS